MSAGFTLLELLVVMGIMVVLMVLMAPLLSSIGGGNNLTKAATDIQGILEQARTYAMSADTYVYVGITEVDTLKAQAVSPTYINGTGRVAISVVASTNGMRPYTNTPGPLSSNVVIPLGKVTCFDNLHLTNGTSLTSGKLAALTNNPTDVSSSIATTTFTWPLTGTAQYQFTNIVFEFSPQGIVRIQTNNSFNPSILNTMEFGLVPTKGNIVISTPNAAVLQINGTTGAAQVYRP